MLFIKTCIEHAMKKTTKNAQMLQMHGCTNKAFLAASAEDGIFCALVFHNCCINFQPLSTMSHLLPAWTTGTVLKKHNKPSSPGRYSAEYSHFGELKFILPYSIKPQIATYFASIMPVASRYRLCQLLCRQIRLKPKI